MTAWDTLVAHSVSGDAWERLNSITGGDGGYLADKQLLFDVEPIETSFSTDPAELSFTADPADVSLSITTPVATFTADPANYEFITTIPVLEF